MDRIICALTGTCWRNSPRTYAEYICLPARQLTNCQMILISISAAPHWSIRPRGIRWSSAGREGWGNSSNCRRGDMESPASRLQNILARVVVVGSNAKKLKEAESLARIFRQIVQKKKIGQRQYLLQPKNAAWMSLLITSEQPSFEFARAEKGGRLLQSATAARRV